MIHAMLRIEDDGRLSVLIGCDIAIDPETCRWVARNHEGYSGSADTSGGAALACFADHLGHAPATPKFCANCGTAIAAPTGCDSCLSLKPNARDSSYQGAHRSPLARLEGTTAKGISAEERRQLSEIFGMDEVDIDIGVDRLQQRMARDGDVSIVKRCDLCDTPLELSARGKAMTFTPHRDDPTFCATMTKGRIADLTKAVRSSARDNAEISARLRHALAERRHLVALLDAVARWREAGDRTEKARADDLARAFCDTVDRLRDGLSAIARRARGEIPR